MQTSRKISVNFAPRIQAAGIQVASVGDSVELKCTIKSKPIPKTMFWKDHDGRIPVIQSANYDMTMMNDINDPITYTMVLKIMKVNRATLSKKCPHRLIVFHFGRYSWDRKMSAIISVTPRMPLGQLRDQFRSGCGTQPL